MEVRATTKYLRMSPRKVRLVVDVVRGMSVDRALTQLAFLNKRAAEPVRKLLESAAANARHNFKLDPGTLIVKKITADGGPILYRSRARAMGSSAPIRKRSTHLTVILDEKQAATKSAKKSAKKTSKKKSAKKPAATS